MHQLDLDVLTAGRLRAESDIAGLKSGPRGIRMLFSYTTFEVNGKGRFVAKSFSACKQQSTPNYCLIATVHGNMIYNKAHILPSCQHVQK